MTLKPTITSSKGANTVLSSSEWNTSVIQSDNYLQELVAGSNSDKIGGTALANPLTVGALSTTGNFSVGGSTTMFGLLASSGTFTSTLTASGGLSATTGTFSGLITGNAGLSITSGTSAHQALTATTGAFSGTLGAGGLLTLTGQTVLTGGANVLQATGASFSGVPSQPAGVFQVSVNGVTAKVPYYV